MVDAADYWRAHVSLRDIHPRGDRFPEVGLWDALAMACTGSVFEFGCGDGRLAPAFSPDAYAGFDINPHALAAARIANPDHRYVTEWEPADTWLSWVTMLHVDDDAVIEVVERAKQYPRIVIGEVMGRKWRRAGNPPVFNRDPEEYAEMISRNVQTFLVPYPRYKCNLTMMVFE